jgi:hypothetical protein
MLRGKRSSTMKTFRWLFGGTLALVLLFGACEDATGPEGTGQVQILLTDAPTDYLSSAEVKISRVYLKAAEEEEGEETEEEGGKSGAVDLFNDADNPMTFDLLDLQNGITGQLTGTTNVEAGDYHQLRMVVAEATVTLIDGYQFRDEEVTKTLHVPSGMQSGIKVQLSGPIEVTDQTLTVLTVDFDVDNNFVIQGNPETPAGIQGVLFTPTLKEKVRTEEDMGG